MKTEVIRDWRIPLTVQLVVKHALDRLGAAVLLALVMPLLVTTGVLVWIGDRGPTFFRQVRAGYDRQPFLIVKFRTMIPNADDYLDEEGRPQRERVTPIGRHLRRWSLDEIPQLWNILKGEMSFVGPRPVPPAYAERMTPRQQRRFAMRPGVTGLAQVSGRHKLTWSQRVEFDLEYIERFNLLLDLRIVARTVGTIFARDTLVERDPSNLDL